MMQAPSQRRGESGPEAYNARLLPAYGIQIKPATGEEAFMPHAILGIPINANARFVTPLIAIQRSSSEGAFPRLALLCRTSLRHRAIAKTVSTPRPSRPKAGSPTRRTCSRRAAFARLKLFVFQQLS
jgi:hypothetical protein